MSKGSISTADCPPISRFGRDLRCRASCLPRTRRRARPQRHSGQRLADAGTGKNGRHALRQAVFGRLAGCEDVNDAERLRHDSATRWIVGGKAASGSAASASQMGPSRGDG